MFLEDAVKKVGEDYLKGIQRWPVQYSIRLIPDWDSVWDNFTFAKGQLDLEPPYFEITYTFTDPRVGKLSASLFIDAISGKVFDCT